MSKSSRRNLLKIAAAGAVTTRLGMAACPEVQKMPAAVITSSTMNLYKEGQSVLLAVQYGGVLNVKGTLHVVGGRLNFAHLPADSRLATAIKEAVVETAKQSYGLNLDLDDIRVVGKPIY